MIRSWPVRAQACTHVLHSQEVHYLRHIWTFLSPLAITHYSCLQSSCYLCFFISCSLYDTSSFFPVLQKTLFQASMSFIKLLSWEWATHTHLFIIAGVHLCPNSKPHFSVSQKNVPFHANTYFMAAISINSLTMLWKFWPIWKMSSFVKTFRESSLLLAVFSL